MNRPEDAAEFSASSTPTAIELAGLVVGSPGAENYLEQAEDLNDWTQHATMTISYDTDNDVLYVDVIDSLGADVASLAGFANETQVSLSDDLTYAYVGVAGFAVMTGCCQTNAREHLIPGEVGPLQKLVGADVEHRARQLVESGGASPVTATLSEATARELVIFWTLQAGHALGHWDDETGMALVTALSDHHLGKVIAQWMAEFSEHGPALPEVVRGVDGAVRLAGHDSEADAESVVSPLQITNDQMPALLSDSWVPDDGPLELEAIAVSSGLAIRLPLPGPLRPGIRVYAVVDLDGVSVEVELVGEPSSHGLPEILSGAQPVDPGSNARLVGITIRRAEED